ncbi:MAG TPA: nitroreductase family protein [Thermomicrobiales bacterium]|nr:nitroreductase family protein [Thermomicrobiales bacterium]
MAEITNTADALEAIRKVRQVRQYEPGSVSDEDLNRILEIARWSGSSRNTQPWRFVIVEDKDVLARLAELRPNITWVANGALAIALVFPGENDIHEAYDEGRVSERVMIAAEMLGLGAGTAWFAENEGVAKQILGVPDDMVLHSVVVLGPYRTSKDPRPTGPKPGRKPLDELVSYGKWGQKQRS